MPYSEKRCAKLARFYHVFKTNVRAVMNYTPQPLGGRVTFLKAEEPLEGPSPEDNWKELALDGLEIHTVPGNHFTTIREPHVRALAQTLAGVWLRNSYQTIYARQTGLRL